MIALWFFLLLSSQLLAVEGSPRMAIIAVSNASELSNALANASAGDKIVLANGEYGSVTLNQNFSDTVTIRSEIPLGAKFDSINVTGASNIRIDAVHVDNPSNGISGASLIKISDGSEFIEVLNSEINGLVDGTYSGFYGVNIGESSDIRFANNNVHDVKDGTWVWNSSNVDVVENSFDYIGNDSMKFASVSSVLIENNTGARHVFAGEGAHLDYLQFQGSNSSDITIRGNVFLPEVPFGSQGIFVAEGGLNNVLIEDNIVYNSLVRGITVGSGTNITIRNNTTLTVPGEGHKASTIDAPAGATVENNIYGFYQGGWSGPNLKADWQNAGSDFYYDALYQNASRGWGITIEDLRPVAGSPAETTGAYQRIFELLGEGGGAPGNTRPDAADDDVSVAEDGAVTFDPAGNDSDPDGDAFEIVGVGSPSNGSATLNGDGTVTYTPDADYVGEDSFTYTIRDAKGGTDTATVFVTIDGTNEDAPVARDDAYSARAGSETTVDVLANDSDPDGDALTLEDHTTTANGTLVNLGGGRFAYTPDEGFTGSDSFSYTVSDGTGRSDTATVTFDVLDFGALPAPVFSEGSNEFSGATGDARILPHDPAYALAEGTLELAFTADSLPSRQGLFTKDATYFGTGGHLGVLLEGDDIRIRLQDEARSHEIRVSNAVQTSTEHHLALTFGPGGMALWLDGEKVGENAYTGGLEGNAEPIVIGANQWGSNDGTADKLEDPFDGTIGRVGLYDRPLSEGEIGLLVGTGETPADPNAAPDARDDAAATDAGQAVMVDVLANDSDPDGDALAITAVGNASNGSVTDNGDGTLTYSPDAGFSGEDTFTYTVTDGVAADTARVRVTVEAATVTPDPGGEITVSSKAQLMSALDTATGGETILLASGDYGALALDGYAFSEDVTIRSQTPLGVRFDTIDVTNSTRLRIDGVHVDNPTDGSPGTAFVEIGAGTEHVAFVNSEVNGSVDGRMVGAYGIRVSDGARNIEVSGNSVHDVEHGAVFFGTSALTVSGNSFNEIGSDSMKFGGVTGVLIEDNVGAAVTVPEAGDHIDFIQFQGDGTDVEIRGNVLLLEDSANKVHQGIFLKDGVFNDVLIEQNLVYTNTVNGIYVQSDAGTGGNLTIRENTVLSPPDTTIWGNADIRMVSLAGNYTIENNVVDRVVDSLGTGTVRNNLSLQWENPGAANHYDDVYVNATAGSGATVEDFRPVAGGPADFGSGLGAEARLAELLNVEGPAPQPNAAPEPADDVAETAYGTAVAIDALANDSDPDGDTLEVTGVGLPANGSVADNGDGTLTYTPDTGFSGEDSFAYTVSDGLASATATVRVTVEAPPNAAPDARDDVASTAYGTAVVIDALANDSDPDGDTLDIVALGAAANGSVAPNPDGTLTYTPDTGFSGQDTFTYTVSDGSSFVQRTGFDAGAATGLTDTATVTVTVEPAPEPNPPSEATDGRLIGAAFGSAEISSPDDVLLVAPREELEVDAATLALEFNLDSVAGRHGLFSKDASHFEGGGNHFTSYVENGDLFVRYQNGQDSEVLEAGGIEAGRDYAFQTSFGDGEVALWLNGTLADSAAFDTSWRSNVEYLQIGANGWASSSGESDFEDVFDGTLSDAVIAEGAMTPDDLAALLAAEGEGWQPTETGGGSSLPEPVFARAGAKNYDGSSDSVDVVAHSLDLEIDEGTISFSFVEDGSGGRQGLVSKDASGYGEGGHFSVYINRGDLVIRFQDENSKAKFTKTDIEPGREYEVDAVFGPDGVFAYVDGALIGKSAGFDGTWETNAEYMQIGGLGWASAPGDDAFHSPFSGEISDFAIYAVALSEEQIVGATSENGWAFEFAV